MNVIFLTGNPNQVSTTVSTEVSFQLLPGRDLKPAIIWRVCDDLHCWAAEQGIPAYQNDLPIPDKNRPLPFLGSLWQTGQRREALSMFRRGLKYWPWDWRCWKTYTVARIRGAFSRLRPANGEEL